LNASDDWFSLAELAERVAQLVWVEEHVAALLDEWASIEPHAGAAIVYARAAAHHRWHGKILRGCLPTSEQLSDASTPHAPTPGWLRAIDALRALDGDDETVVRLMGIVRKVDPWLARESAVLLDLARPVADAALIRWLGFIQIDHRDDGGHLAELLDALQTNTVSLRDRSLIAGLDLSGPLPTPG